jgi:hypothetical protein
MFKINLIIMIKNENENDTKQLISKTPKASPGLKPMSLFHKTEERSQQQGESKDNSFIKELNKKIVDKRMTISNVILSTNQFKAYKAPEAGKSIAASYDEKAIVDFAKTQASGADIDTDAVQKTNLVEKIEEEEEIAYKKKVVCGEDKTHYHEGSHVDHLDHHDQVERVENIKPDGCVEQNGKIEQYDDVILINEQENDKGIDYARGNEHIEKVNIDAKFSDFTPSPIRNTGDYRIEAYTSKLGSSIRGYEKSPYKHSLYKKDIAERSQCQNYTYHPVKNNYTESDKNHLFSKYHDYKHDAEYIKRRDKFFESRSVWDKTYNICKNRSGLIYESNQAVDYSREWGYEDIINDTNGEVSQYMSNLLYNLRLENQKRDLENLEQRYLDRYESLKTGKSRPTIKAESSCKGLRQTKQKVCPKHKRPVNPEDPVDELHRKKKELYSKYIDHLKCKISNTKYRGYDMDGSLGLSGLKEDINRAKRISKCLNCKFCTSFVDQDDSLRKSGLYYDERPNYLATKASKQLKHTIYSPAIWPTNNI